MKKLLFVLPILLPFWHGVAFAQSWRGTMNDVDFQIAKRPQQGINTFVVFANRTQLSLTCGVIDSVTHNVLFCADDMGKYANFSREVTVRYQTYYNLVFSHQKIDYWCEASTGDSPLFCRFRSGQGGFSKGERKLDRLGH